MSKELEKYISRNEHLLKEFIVLAPWVVGMIKSTGAFIWTTVSVGVLVEVLGPPVMNVIGAIGGWGYNQAFRLINGAIPKGKFKEEAYMLNRGMTAPKLHWSGWADALNPAKTRMNATQIKMFKNEHPYIDWNPKSEKYEVNYLHASVYEKAEMAIQEYFSVRQNKKINPLFRRHRWNPQGEYIIDYLNRTYPDGQRGERSILTDHGIEGLRDFVKQNPWLAFGSNWELHDGTKKKGLGWYCVTRFPHRWFTPDRQQDYISHDLLVAKFFQNDSSKKQLYRRSRYASTSGELPRTRSDAKTTKHLINIYLAYVGEIKQKDIRDYPDEHRAEMLSISLGDSYGDLAFNRDMQKRMASPHMNPQTVISSSMHEALFARYKAELQRYKGPTARLDPAFVKRASKKEKDNADRAERIRADANKLINSREHKEFNDRFNSLKIDGNENTKKVISEMEREGDKNKKDNQKELQDVMQRAKKWWENFTEADFQRVENMVKDIENFLKKAPEIINKLEQIEAGAPIESESGKIPKLGDNPLPGQSVPTIDEQSTFPRPGDVVKISSGRGKKGKAAETKPVKQKAKGDPSGQRVSHDDAKKKEKKPTTAKNQIKPPHPRAEHEIEEGASKEPFVLVYSGKTPGFEALPKGAPGKMYTYDYQVLSNQDLTVVRFIGGSPFHKDDTILYSKATGKQIGFIDKDNTVHLHNNSFLGDALISGAGKRFIASLPVSDTEKKPEASEKPQPNPQTPETPKKNTKSPQDDQKTEEAEATKRLKQAEAGKKLPFETNNKTMARIQKRLLRDPKLREDKLTLAKIQGNLINYFEPDPREKKTFEKSSTAKKYFRELDSETVQEQRIPSFQVLGDGNYGDETKEAIKAFQRDMIKKQLLAPLKSSKKRKGFSNIDGLYGPNTHQKQYINAVRQGKLRKKPIAKKEKKDLVIVKPRTQQANKLIKKAKLADKKKGTKINCGEFRKISFERWMAIMVARGCIAYDREYGENYIPAELKAKCRLCTDKMRPKGTEKTSQQNVTISKNVFKVKGYKSIDKEKQFPIFRVKEGGEKEPRPLSFLVTAYRKVKSSNNPLAEDVIYVPTSLPGNVRDIELRTLDSITGKKASSGRIMPIYNSEGQGIGWFYSGVPYFKKRSEKRPQKVIIMKNQEQSVSESALDSYFSSNIQLSEQYDFALAEVHLNNFINESCDILGIHY